MNFTNKHLENKLIILLFSIIPIAYLIGSAIYEFIFFLIILLFLSKLIKSRNIKQELKSNKSFLLLLILWMYLVINTFVSDNPYQSIQRNILFIKFILLIFSFKYLIQSKITLQIIMNIWSLTIIIVCFDVFYEFIFGSNLLGFKSPMENERIVSFFKDELIVGSFIFGFSFPIIVFFLKNKNYFTSTILSIIFILAIILSGERSMFFKLVFAVIILALFAVNFKKFKFLIVSFFVIILAFTMLSSNIKHRYTNTIQNTFSFNYDLNIYDNVLTTKYINQSLIAYELFKKNKAFGVGNKNYFSSCQNTLETKLKKECYIHPHQTYYELLSEHGILGSLIILVIIYKLISNNYFNIKNDYFDIQMFLKIYLIASMIPIIPTGSFFGSYAMSLFWLNYSFLQIYSNKSIQ